MTPPKASSLAEQDMPVVQVIGRISAEGPESDGAGVKYLLHAGWSRKTYQVSNRGLKVLRTMDITVLDEPDEYTV